MVSHLTHSVNTPAACKHETEPHKYLCVFGREYYESLMRIRVNGFDSQNMGNIEMLPCRAGGVIITTRPSGQRLL